MTPFDYPYDCDVILQKKRRLRRELLTQSGLIPKKIAILSGSTIGEIKPILELFFASPRHSAGILRGRICPLL